MSSVFKPSPAKNYTEDIEVFEENSEDDDSSTPKSQNSSSSKGNTENISESSSVSDASSFHNTHRRLQFSTPNHTQSKKIGKLGSFLARVRATRANSLTTFRSNYHDLHTMEINGKSSFKILAESSFPQCFSNMSCCTSSSKRCLEYHIAIAQQTHGKTLWFLLFDQETYQNIFEDLEHVGLQFILDSKQGGFSILRQGSTSHYFMQLFQLFRKMFVSSSTVDLNSVETCILLYDTRIIRRIT